MFATDSLWLTVATGAALLLVACCASLHRTRNYWKKRQVFSAKTGFLIGSLPQTLHGKCSLSEELHEIYLQYKTEHRFVGLLNGVCPKLFILHPKLAAQIMKDKFNSFHDNEGSQWISPKADTLRACSPFVSTGEDWKSKRSELTPALTPSRLRAFFPVMLASAAKLVSYLELKQKKGPLDAKQVSHRYTVDLMANFIWSVESDAFCDNAELGTLHKMAESMMVQATRCAHFFQGTSLWPWLRQLWTIRFYPQQTDRFFIGLAQCTLKRQTERSDFINFLQLRSKRILDDVLIAGHTATMLVDGFETSAVLIAHCLLLLSRDSRVQRKLREELDGDSGNEHTFEALNALPYLDQCLQETLRIFPPLTPLSKLCTQRTTIDLGEQRTASLEKGDVVYISSYSFHHDADYYESPEQFWPERFDAILGGVKKYRDQGVFLPFGDGPRMCMGMKLGVLEAKVAVSEVIRHFEVTSSRCTRVDNKISSIDFLISLEGGIRLHFLKYIEK